MPTLILRNGKWLDREFAPPLYPARPAPGVISDNMDATRHMANNRYYTSKSAFRAATKAAGCVEIGNDQSILKPRKRVALDRGKRRDDIKKSIYNLRNKSRS